MNMSICEATEAFYCFYWFLPWDKNLSRLYRGSSSFSRIVMTATIALSTLSTPAWSFWLNCLHHLILLPLPLSVCLCLCLSPLHNCPGCCVFIVHRCLLFIITSNGSQHTTTLMALTEPYGESLVLSKTNIRCWW